MERAEAIGAETIEEETIVGAFRHAVTEFPGEAALHYRKASSWEPITWAEYGLRVDRVAAALEELGIESGERIAILSGNRFEWHVADLGILSHGNVTVPLYPTSSAEQVEYLLGHSESRVCFVENRDLFARVLQVRDQLPRLNHIVVFADDVGIDIPEVVSFSSLCATGSQRLEREPDVVEQCASRIEPEQLATLVYTSGTTGPPKATMILHGNIIWTLRSVVSMFEIEHGERFLSFLPLSHVAERMMSDFAPIVVGGDTWFAESIGTVARDLLECRPTIFFGVPRIWEKMHDLVAAKLSDANGADRAVLHRYLKMVKHDSEGITDAGHSSLATKLSHKALDVAVGAKIRARLGLDKAHILVSGAAPINPELLRFLHGMSSL